MRKTDTVRRAVEFGFVWFGLVWFGWQHAEKRDVADSVTSSTQNYGIKRVYVGMAAFGSSSTKYQNGTVLYCSSCMLAVCAERL